jgi:hypothetical protein
MKTSLAIVLCALLWLGLTEAQAASARHPPTSAHAYTHPAVRHGASMHRRVVQSGRARTAHAHHAVRVYNAQNYQPQVYGKAAHRPSSFAPHSHSGSIPAPTR